jgi:tRNA(adenine34) deaminase
MRQASLAQGEVGMMRDEISYRAKLFSPIGRREVLCAALGAAGVLAAAPRASVAEARKMPPQPEDERFMRLALEEAAKGDFPFGAVIVRAGEVLAKGRNLGKTNNDPTAHGEMVAIREFVATRPAAELAGTALYTSGEPCPMCMGAIVWCGVGRVVFAASIEQLTRKIGQIMLTSRRVAQAAPFARIAITGGVLSAEALALFDK